MVEVVHFVPHFKGVLRLGKGVGFGLELPSPPLPAARHTSSNTTQFNTNLKNSTTLTWWSAGVGEIVD